MQPDPADRSPATRRRGFSRRAALALPFVLPAAAGRGRAPVDLALTVSAQAQGGNERGFEKGALGTVGVFDGDWLLQPGFTRVLDNIAASPGAFHGVRFFGAFTSGQLDAYTPDSGGRVWRGPGQAINFSSTFQALDALTRRGLVPFVALGFFPPAVSASPIRPPSDWAAWKTLVRAFFHGLVSDPRFGAEAIARWWFEVWNEPNDRRFWLGTPDDYLALYRATAEAIAEVGVKIRLGGPAIAYKPEVSPADGPPWMARFLHFVAANPHLPCDFLSLHRKGTVGVDHPNPRRLFAAAATTADQALAIDRQRFAGITIINDEADEKVGFEVPYAPRVDHHSAAWLGAVAGIQAVLGERYQEADLQFVGAADNANLQLVRAPFDGRRSIMTRATAGSETDLLKVPAYGFYELLRLMGDRHATVVSGAEQIFPRTDLYHLSTVAASHAAALLAYYPDPERDAPGPRTLDYVITDLPWTWINVARFQIDQTRSNAYTAAGGSAANPFPAPEPTRLEEVRQAQEVTLFRPIARGLATPDGIYRETLTLAPFTTVCLWITPVEGTAPEAPRWVEAAPQDGNVLLRWTPNREPAFFSYEVVLLRDGIPAEPLTPNPLRAALWVDTAPPPGRRRYAVRAVSASGVASPFVASGVVHVDR